MPKKIISLPLLLLVLTGGGASAQIPNASQQVDSLQQRRQLESSLPAGTNAAPEFYAGETSDVGPQSVLRVRHRRTLVEASADEQYFYTDNMFLADHGQQGADVLVSTVQAALAPTPCKFADGLLAPRLGYQHQWFNYGLASSGTVNAYDFSSSVRRQADFDAFDFNVSTFFGDVAWSRKNWTFSLGADFRQLLDAGSDNEFYRETVPRWSLRRDFSGGEATSFAIVYEGDYRVTAAAAPRPPGYSDRFNDRTDQSLVLVGSWRLCSHAILQPFYRFQFTHYTRIERDDVLHSFGLGLYCPVTRQATLRAYVGYDNLNTDGLYSQNFEQLTAGGGLNLTVRF